MNLSNNELVLVQGGAFSASLLNALSRAVTTIFDLGRAIGSSLRRLTKKNYC